MLSPPFYYTIYLWIYIINNIIIYIAWTKNFNWDSLSSLRFFLIFQFSFIVVANNLLVISPNSRSSKTSSQTEWTAITILKYFAESFYFQVQLFALVRPKWQTEYNRPSQFFKLIKDRLLLAVYFVLHSKFKTLYWIVDF